MAVFRVWAVLRTGQIPGGKKAVNTSAGTYVLILHNKQVQTIAVGKLGTFSFPRGYFVYTGSAFGPGGLPARVGRHLKPHKLLRWHIDYLTACIPVIRIWQTRHPKTCECPWAGYFQTLGGSIIVPGFGASDCRCCTHLFFFKKMPKLSTFRKLTAPIRVQSRKTDISGPTAYPGI